MTNHERAIELLAEVLADLDAVDNPAYVAEAVNRLGVILAVLRGEHDLVAEESAS